MMYSLFLLLPRVYVGSCLPTCRDHCQLSFKVQAVKRNARNSKKLSYLGGGVSGNWFSENVNEPIRLEHGEKDDRKWGQQSNTGKMK